MKTVLVHIDGELEVGDVICVCWAHLQRGGQSTARYDVPEPVDRIVTVDGKKVVETSAPTIRDAVARLAHEANKFDGYSARQRNDREFVIQCSDAVDQVKFYGSCTGKQVVTVEDLA